MPGVEDVLIRLAKCCTPVPSDEVVGYISMGKGITVHRRDCPNVRALMRNPERFTPVEWEGGTSQSFRVHIAVHAWDRPRLLEDVARTFAEHGANIVSYGGTVEDQLAKNWYVAELGDVKSLTRPAQLPARRRSGLRLVPRHALVSTDRFRRCRRRGAHPGPRSGWAPQPCCPSPYSRCSGGLRRFYIPLPGEASAERCDHGRRLAPLILDRGTPLVRGMIPRSRDRQLTSAQGTPWVSQPTRQ